MVGRITLIASLAAAIAVGLTQPALSEPIPQRGVLRFEQRVSERYDHPNRVHVAFRGLGRRERFYTYSSHYASLRGRRQWGFQTLPAPGRYRVISFTRECVAADCPAPGSGDSPEPSQLGPRIDRCVTDFRMRRETDLRAEVLIRPYQGCQFTISQTP